MATSDEKFEIVIVGDARRVASSEKIITVEVGERRVQIPNSQIDDDSEVWRGDDGTPGDLHIPRWLAEDRELEYRERGRR